MNAPFFRPAAVAAKSNQWAGTIILARPVPMRLASLIAALIILALTLYLSFGEYTRKVRVSGQIVPAGGSISVIADRPGRIKARMVEEGATVSAGQAMFELRSERTSSGGGVDARIGILLAERQNELLQSRQLETEELAQRAEALAVRQRASRPR